MTAKRGKTTKQIEDIMSTQAYQGGDEFTASDMLDRLEKFTNSSSRITTKQRISQLLIEMQSMGLVDRVVQNGVVRFRKPASRMLRKRWVSEVAEEICCRNPGREISGQAARDAFRRARALASISEASCGGCL